MKNPAPSGPVGNGSSQLRIWAQKWNWPALILAAVALVSVDEYLAGLVLVCAAGVSLFVVSNYPFGHGRGPKRRGWKRIMGSLFSIVIVIVGFRWTYLYRGTKPWSRLFPVTSEDASIPDPDRAHLEMKYVDFYLDTSDSFDNGETGSALRGTVTVINVGQDTIAKGTLIEVGLSFHPSIIQDYETLRSLFYTGKYLSANYDDGDLIYPNQPISFPIRVPMSGEEMKLAKNKAVVYVTFASGYADKKGRLQSTECHYYDWPSNINKNWLCDSYNEWTTGDPTWSGRSSPAEPFLTKFRAWIASHLPI